MKITLKVIAEYPDREVVGEFIIETTRIPEPEDLNKFLERMGKELLLKCDK
jgi:hypothetical protein